ncbi:unnamed protein product (macronuclear) [Paramecium tetraurelia]|uniref:Transmembrane protein n=1 Tax=Paramecium tetraurelia TaxID=5888 RepID=A0BLN8_PARTE|nr:uncharacterized protein GSPATT00030088001 [Paramecium tetraurelia]CAK59455.1 unnamed protein product [Paramecium tetraurelia]|eukprot:XP_001426853.1 hypothetical protein (macronuclear) [Paramecium tetraurelia strain d4-2]
MTHKKELLLFFQSLIIVLYLLNHLRILFVHLRVIYLIQPIWYNLLDKTKEIQSMDTFLKIMIESQTNKWQFHYAINIYMFKGYQTFYQINYQQRC